MRAGPKGNLKVFSSLDACRPAKLFKEEMLVARLTGLLTVNHPPREVLIKSEPCKVRMLVASSCCARGIGQENCAPSGRYKIYPLRRRRGGP